MENSMGDSTLNDVVSGKRVAIVGPSRNIENYQDGDYIDSFDVVVRINDARTDETHRGVKTDVVYIDGGMDRVDRHHEAHFVLVYPPSVWFADRHNSTREFMSTSKRNHSHIADDFYWSLSEKLNTPKLEYNVRPNTGTMAIFHLMSFSPKSLYITGLDFYAGGYEPQHKLGGLTTEHIKNMMMSSDGGDHHCPPRQFKRFLELYESNKDVMTLYPPLQELVENPDGRIL